MFQILGLAYSLREMPHSLREVHLLGVNKCTVNAVFKAFPSGEGGMPKARRMRRSNDGLLYFLMLSSSTASGPPSPAGEGFKLATT